MGERTTTATTNNKDCANQVHEFHDSTRILLDRLDYAFAFHDRGLTNIVDATLAVKVAVQEVASL